MLLEHGAQLDYHRCSELWIAARKGNNEILKLLVPYAAKQRSPEKLIKHEFSRVLLKGSADIVREYLRHDRSLANVYTYSRFHDDNPIHLAMSNEIAKVLLEFGTDFNARQMLYTAAWGRADTFEVLLSSGAILDDPNKLIHHAVKWGNGETLKALLAMPFAETLDKSRSIEVPSCACVHKCDVSSALHHAILQLEPECTQHLLAFGFDPNICLWSRLTPAHLLFGTTPDGSNLSQLKLLLGANADFEIKSDAFTSAPVTPFQLAMIRGRYVEANLLAESGCVNIHNVQQFVDLDFVEEKIDEICACKRRFRFCTYKMYGSLRVYANIFAKPVHLVEMIRNPRSLLELSRVTVRKQLNRRIDRVQETGLPPVLQDDVTRKHFIDAALDCYELEENTICECGQPIIAFY